MQLNKTKTTLQDLNLDIRCSWKEKKKPKTTHKLNLPLNILNLQAIIVFNFQNKIIQKWKITWEAIEQTTKLPQNQQPNP